MGYQQEAIPPDTKKEKHHDKANPQAGIVE